MRLISLVAAAAIVAAPLVANAASLRLRGGTIAPEPPTTETCPQGLSYTSFDGCLDAQPTAQFKDPNLLATYALSSTGASQTIYHAPPYNVAGIHFGVGMTTPLEDKDDPRDFSVVGTATFPDDPGIGGQQSNSVLFVSITNGGTPKVGMYVWDRPANGTQWFATPANVPRISGACTGSLPALSCPIDRTISVRGGFTAYASLWAGCVTLITGGGTNGTSNATYDKIYCDFRNSMNGATAEIDNITFDEINGHPATLLVTDSNPSGLSWGHVKVNNSYLAPDDLTAGSYTLTSGLADPNIRLTLINSECSGGNEGTPVAGPWTYDSWFGCVSWDSPGSSNGLFGRNQVIFQNIYAHDYAGNPFSPQAGNTDTVAQNIVAIRTAMNCGDSGGSNGCHGTLFALGTTLVGSSGSMKARNITAVYPYGQRFGVITAAVSLQGGVGSAATLDVEFSGLTIIGNTGSTAGKAVLGGLARVHRVGAISNLKLQHLYANSHGTSGCFVIAGDLQASNSHLGVMVANAGQRNSTITFSGLVGNPGTLPAPGMWLVTGFGSVTPNFRATFTDRGDGMSNMTIIGTPPATIAAGLQLAALQMADPTLHPTLVVSGSGNNYIVDNGTGQGETRAEQNVAVAQMLMPFGTTDPATGSPMTATGGSVATSRNGSWVANGYRTFTAPNPGPTKSGNWGAYAPALGNSTTVVAESNNLWMMNISGDAGKITLDGVQLDAGSCPGTQSGT